MVLRERVELAPADTPKTSANDRAAGPGIAPRSTPGDSLDLPVDPLQFGPIRGYNIVYPRLYTTSPGGPWNITTAELTAATPGQAPQGEVEVFSNGSAGYQLWATMPMTGGWTFADTYSIGTFNGSSCGDGDWYWSVYDIQDTVPLARIPSGVGLGADLRLDYGDCYKPNSITDWCTCHLSTTWPVKHASAFGVWWWAYEAIVPSALLVTAEPDTLDVAMQAALTLRLVDDSVAGAPSASLSGRRPFQRGRDE